MRKYELIETFVLRKTDKALFDFSKAQLIQFNGSGFDILLSALEGNKMLSEKENNFLKRLVDEGYIREYQ